MVSVHLVLPEEKPILNNLLEKYEYEFTQWEPKELGDDGLYHYPYLESYFGEAGCFPYFIQWEGKLAGLALVSSYPDAPGYDTQFCLAEFFILHNYRRKGLGRAAAAMIFSLHRGNWQLKYHPKNLPSVHFWNKVVGEYTNGRYILLKNYPDPAVNYSDGTPASVIIFSNREEQ